MARFRTRTHIHVKIMEHILNGRGDGEVEFIIAKLHRFQLHLPFGFDGRPKQFGFDVFWNKIFDLIPIQIFTFHFFQQCLQLGICDDA